MRSAILPRCFAVAVVGAAPLVVVPAATASPTGAPQLGPVTVTGGQDFHASVQVRLPGCDFATWQQRTLTTVTVGQRSHQVVSDAAAPHSDTVTVPVPELGNPGAEAAIGASCEIGDPVCPPAPQPCLGTSLVTLPAQRWKIPFPQYLAPGTILDRANPSVSAPGPDGSRLTLQENGNLVHTGADGRPLWASGTSGQDVELHAQADGNVVLYADARTAPKPLWATWTQGHPGARLVLLDDQLVVYSPAGQDLWHNPQDEQVFRPPILLPDELPAGRGLGPGDVLPSAGRRTWLVMQHDGNLVAYGPGDRALWQSGTAGHPGSRVQLRRDGNLVVFSPRNRVLWNTGTRTGQRLTMQDDGNLVLYSASRRPVWASGTRLWQTRTVPAQAAN